MDILGNLNLDKIFKTAEQKAPELGTLYGIFGPLAETSKTVGDSPIDAIVREVTALTNPKMPTFKGVMNWWKAYAVEPAKMGILAWLGGELLGNSRIAEAGVNILKGTAISAVIGEVGQGGGAPYGESTNPTDHDTVTGRRGTELPVNQNLNVNFGAY